MKKLGTIKIIAMLVALLSIMTVILMSTMTSSAVVTVKVDSYAKLKNALDNAAAGTRIIMTADITVPSGSVISVPTGVKLILACDEKGNYGGNDAKDYYCSLDLNDRHYTSSTFSGDPKYTFTVEKGASVNIYGNFYIGGILTSYPSYYGDDIGKGNTSTVYSKAIVDGDMSVIGGALYTYGYLEGNGRVDCRNSGNVYTPFVICGFKTGSYFYGMSNVASQCPVTEYSMPNIRCRTDINYGSNLYGMFALYSGDMTNVCTSKLIGPSNALLIPDSSDSVISISYSESPDSSLRFGKTKFTINGDTRLGYLQIEILYKMVSTENFLFPICHGIELDVVSGTFTVEHPISLLPGAKITIGKDATGIISDSGQLLISQGLHDTADYFDHYPYSDRLEANSCSSVGELELYGTLIVENGGLFAGTVNKVDGGVIVLKERSKLSGTIQMGMAARFNVNFKDYEYYNKTTYKLKAQALGTDGKLFELEAGKNYYSANVNDEALINSFNYTYYGTEKNDLPKIMTGSSWLSLKGSVHSRGIVYLYADGSEKTSDTNEILSPSSGKYWYNAYTGEIIESIQNKDSFYMLCECDRAVEIMLDGKSANYAVIDGKIPTIGNEKQHYSFVGYSLTEDGSADLQQGDDLPQGITRLYAVWEVMEYEIRYYLDDLNYSVYNGKYLQKTDNGYLIAIRTQKYGDSTDLSYLRDEMAVSEHYFEWQALAHTVDGDIDVYGVYFEYGVRNNTTGVIHPTLSAAIENAKNGDVLRLQSDFVESVIIPEGLSLTIDMNGCTLSFDRDSVIQNDGNLTLTDSRGGGKIVQTGKGASSSSAYYALSNSIDASLIIDGVTLENSVDSTNTRTIYNRGNVSYLGGKIVSPCGYAVYNYGTKAEFRQLGGCVEFTGSSASSYGVYNYNNAKYVLDGGSIISFGSGKTFCNYLKSTLILNGGEISSENGGSVYNNGGRVDICGGRISTSAISSQTYAIQCTKASSAVPELNVYGGEIVATSGSRAVYNNSGVMNVYGGYIASEGASTSAWGIYNYYLSTLNIYGGEIYSKKSHAVYNYSASSSNVPTLNVYGGIIRSDAGGNYYPVMNADSSKYGKVNISGGAFISAGNYSVYSASSSQKINIEASALGGEYKYIKSAFYNYQDSTGGYVMSPTVSNTYIMAGNSGEYTVRSITGSQKDYVYMSEAIRDGGMNLVLLADASLNYPISEFELTVDLAGHTLTLGANTLKARSLTIKDSVGGGKVVGMNDGGFSSVLFEGNVVLGELYREGDVFLGYSPDNSKSIYSALPEKGGFTLYPVFASQVTFNIVFKNSDGSIISDREYHYGDIIDIPEMPTHIYDEAYVYIFKGWSGDVSNECTADAEYMAVYTPIRNEYKVTFRDVDGALLSELTYYYGDSLIFVPSADKGSIGYTERYDFSHWVDQNGVIYSDAYTVKGNTEFTAVYKTVKLTDSYDSDTVRFDSATVVFESSMAINFRTIYEDLKDYEKVYAVFVKHSADGSEQSVIISDYTINGNYMVFCYDGIVAKEIGDEITANVYAIDGDTRYCSSSIEYGVRTYAERMIARTSTTNAFRKSLIAMLDYGAAAQVYFGYNTDDLANSSITPSMRPSGMFDGGNIELTSVTNYEKNGSESATFASATLLFVQNVTINYQIDLSRYTKDKNNLSVVLKYIDCNGTEEIYVRDFADMKQNGSYYLADFDCIAVKDMGQTITTEIYENYYDPDNRINVSGVLTYSIESYAASKQNSTTPGLAELVKYMMAFSRETKAYFAQ